MDRTWKETVLGDGRKPGKLTKDDKAKLKRDMVSLINDQGGCWSRLWIHLDFKHDQPLQPANMFRVNTGKSNSNLIVISVSQLESEPIEPPEATMVSDMEVDEVAASASVPEVQEVAAPASASASASVPEVQEVAAPASASASVPEVQEVAASALEVQEVPGPLTIPIINEPEGSNEPHGRPRPGRRGPLQQLEGIVIDFADFSKHRREGSRPGSSERPSGESEEEEELTRKVPSGGLTPTTPTTPMTPTTAISSTGSAEQAAPELAPSNNENDNDAPPPQPSPPLPDSSGSRPASPGPSGPRPTSLAPASPAPGRGGAQPFVILIPPAGQRPKPQHGGKTIFPAPSRKAKPKKKNPPSDSESDVPPESEDSVNSESGK